MDKIKIEFFSFGIKNVWNGKGNMSQADLYLDCRGVANPAYSGLSGCGDDLVVQAWVDSFTDLGPFLDMIEEAISRLEVRRGKGKISEKPFVIACFCAHGIHRSKAMKHILADRIKKGALGYTDGIMLKGPDGHTTGGLIEIESVVVQ